MKQWRQLRGHVRNLLAYLAPEPSLVSPRKHVAVVAALLGVAAIAGAVVLTPSHRRAKETPDPWETLRRQVSKRAQVDLYDDFSEGLDAWETGQNRPTTWSYDKNGFVNLGSLSLYTPSMHLTNYDLDALAPVVTV